MDFKAKVTVVLDPRCEGQNIAEEIYDDVFQEDGFIHLVRDKITLSINKNHVISYRNEIIEVAE